ncbi:MAG: FtsX-like permease family protein [Deltaproteobacteria bacterium]|nr:FtsX-like permease family protein [Deltaproteobacteria bacterium]
MSRFVWAMLLREIRSSWKRMAFLSLAVAAGVGGLVAVRAFGLALDGQMVAEARSLMAADMVMASTRPFVPREQAALDDLQRRGAQVVISREFVSMARTAKGTKLVEVRTVDPGYPFYGRVETGSGRPLWESLNQNTLVANRSLLLHLGLRVGDEIRLGNGRFRVADELIREPDGAVQLFSLGPKVILTTGGGEATGLIQPGSMVRYRALIKLPPKMDPLLAADRLKSRLPDRYAEVRTFDQAQPQVNRFIGQLTRYLNLVGLVALVLGGVGVSSAIRAFLTRKLDTIAIIKCLGGSSRQVLWVYLAQTAALGMAGSLMGAALGLGLQGLVARLLEGLLPVDLVFQPSWRAALEGLALGTLTTLAFSLPPILEARQAPPARVFRRDVEPMSPPRQRRRRAVLWIGIALPLLAGLSYWESGSAKMGGIFFGGLLGAVAALLLAAKGVLWLLPRLGRPPFFVWRQGLAGLYRPGNQTPLVVISLGLGVLLVLAVYVVRGDLFRQIGVNAPQNAPNLFFVDIQPRQQTTFNRVVAGQGLTPPRLLPLVRGRIQDLNGKPVRLDDLDGDEELRRTVSFEYALTYRDTLENGEELLSGTMGVNPAIPGPQVSVADWWVERTHLGLGDTVTVNIQGLPLTATITSIRKLNWRSRQINFSLVFMPGFLENAPQVFTTAMRVEDTARRVALQQALSQALPNVTSIDAEGVIHTIQNIMDRIAAVVQFMAAFTIAVGMVILAGSLSTTKYQRLREVVLLKTLGAARLRVAGVLAVEYLLLGGVAGGVGAAAAGVLSWGLVTRVFQGEWQWHPLPYLAAWAGAAGLTVLMGVIGSLDILAKKPLEVLREE